MRQLIFKLPWLQLREISNNWITLDCPISFDAKEMTPANASSAIPKTKMVLSSEYIMQNEVQIKISKPAFQNKIDYLKQHFLYTKSLSITSNTNLRRLSINIFFWEQEVIFINDHQEGAKWHIWLSINILTFQLFYNFAGN